MPRVDNKHCIQCGEPTTTSLCVECEKGEYYAYLQELAEGGE